MSRDRRSGHGRLAGIATTVLSRIPIARKWLQLAAPAGAIVLAASAALLSPADARAEDNVVSLEPAGIVVAPGGSFTVSLVDDPTPASTAIWAIDVAFDPAVVSVPDPIEDCDTIDTPGGAIGAFDCQVVDTDRDGRPDTVKVLGVVLYTRTQLGLTEVSTLADITFTVAGNAGDCSDLRLRIRSHADSEGQETGARVQDGRVCIRSDAPPTGTASPVPFTPRTSEPTETPGPGQTGGVPTLPGGQETASPGQTRDPDETGGGAASESPAGLTGTPTSPSGEPGDDDDGTSPLLWVGIAALVAVLAAGAAWAVIRLRSARPGDGPPGPSAS
jgi:hypothetical protein